MTRDLGVNTRLNRLEAASTLRADPTPPHVKDLLDLTGQLSNRGLRAILQSLTTRPQ